MVQPLWKADWQFLTKLNILLPYNLAIMLLGIYPKLWEFMFTQKPAYEFLAALFILTKTWKCPKCPSVGEWINKLWHTQKMEYYSTLKGNELSSHKQTWRNLKCILLSDRSQSEKASYCMIPTTWHEKGKLWRH